jgi:hypothetical protein
MTVNDAELVTQPIDNTNLLGCMIQPSVADSRLTFQHFNNSDLVTATVAPHNSDVRYSHSSEWPPNLIFDVAYGCASLKTWGVPTFLNFARQHTRDIYYNNVYNRVLVSKQATLQTFRTPTLRTWSWHYGRKMRGRPSLKHKQ